MLIIQERKKEVYSNSSYTFLFKLCTCREDIIFIKGRQDFSITIDTFPNADSRIPPSACISVKVPDSLSTSR